MRKSNKKLFLLTGILGMVALLLIVLHYSLPKIVDSEIIDKRVNAYLFEKTGGSITLEKSEIYLLPLPHIILHQVSISIPNKATGLIQSIDIYPDVWVLMRGDVKLSKLYIESPRFTVAISENKEKKSLKEIEEKMRSFVHALHSLSPALNMTIQDGKLDLTRGDRIAFAFDTIQSGLSMSEKSLNISLTCASNLWDSLSFNASLHGEDLKSNGTIQVNHLRPHALFAQLFPKTAGLIGDSEADFSVKYQALGLQQIHAEVESLVPGLVLTRGKESISIKDLNVRGDIDVNPESMSIVLSELSSSSPDMKISGDYTLDETSGIMGIDLVGESIDVRSMRTSALSFGGDIPVVRTIFDYLQEGKVHAMEFHTSGKSPDNLGNLENMKITGNLVGGDIYIPAKDLNFRNVSGDVVISNGILEGKNIKADIGNHLGSKGNVRVGLKGKDALFNLDMFVKADMAELPSLLRQKNLIKNEAILREIDRLSDTQGTAQGRLILGDRINSIHVITDVSQMNVFTRYEPLPFPLVITGGQVSFDEKSLKITDVHASLGNSSFTRLTGQIELTDSADFEVTGRQMSISADEIYPWITSFEKIKPVLKEVPSMQGTIAVSSLRMKGPLHQPNDWEYLVNGAVKTFALDATFLPGKAEDMSGMFTITQDGLSLKDVRTKMVDSVLNASGTFIEFPSDIDTIDLTLQGEVGPKVTAWISRLIKLPPELSIHSPLSIATSTLFWEKDRNTKFDGRLEFSRETQVSLRLAKTPDELSVHEVLIKDKETDVTASLMLNKRTIDLAFKGILASRSFNNIFADNTFSGSSVQGDFSTHILLKDPKQSSIEGVIKGQNIPIPWGYNIPLVVESISLEGRGKSVLVDSAQFFIGEERFSGKGTIDTSQELFLVDVDLSVDGFDWETIEKIAGGTKEAEGNTQIGSIEDIPLKGTIRLQADSFTYRQFRWEPLYADVSFGGERIHIRSKKAALCGISTTGDIDITPEGAEIDIALAAKDVELEPTILCISDKRVDVTGKFDMKAEIKAKGKLDTIAKSLNGSFTVSSEKGKIYKSQSLDKTLDLVNKTENVKGTLPDLNKTMIDYRSFTANGTLKENMVNVEQATLDASSFGILAQGQVDIYNETIDLNALVAPVNFAQGIVGKIPVLGKITGGSLVSIPVKISGKLNDPQVSFLSPSAIGSAFIGMMERTIKLPISIIEPVLPRKPQQQ
jgi:hypothetical protein